MIFQLDSLSSLPTECQPAAGSETLDLLRQMLEVQREQLAQLRVSVAAHDVGARWRAFLERWQTDFPHLSGACRQAIPVLEHTYGKLIAELTDHLSRQGEEALDNDFTLQEFLDRYGMRLAQLGTILNLVAPLAEAGSAGESA
jgi:hypothetical protein